MDQSSKGSKSTVCIYFFNGGNNASESKRTRQNLTEIESCVRDQRHAGQSQWISPDEWKGNPGILYQNHNREKQMFCKNHELHSITASAKIFKPWGKKKTSLQGLQTALKNLCMEPAVQMVKIEDHDKIFPPYWNTLSIDHLLPNCFCSITNYFFGLQSWHQKDDLLSLEASPWSRPPVNAEPSGNQQPVSQQIRQRWNTE